MFDSVDAFTQGFKPTEGGYLYYPSNTSGGKLVTVDEYNKLIEDWRKVAGRSGTWKLIGIVMVAILVWTAISKFLSVPDWFDPVITAALAIGVSARLAWAIFAPWRLVRNRPAIMPPRPISEAKREARALLNWRFVFLIFLFSGFVFLTSISAPERDLSSWAWLVGSGAVFCLNIWIAIQKYRDR